MTIALPVCAAVSALAACAFIAIRLTRSPVWGLLSKTFASMAFVASGGIALYLASARGSPVSGSELLVVGLAFGMAGDILLDLKRVRPDADGAFLSAGILAFSAGHSFSIASVVLVAGSLGVPGVLVPALGSLCVAALASPLSMMVSRKVLKARYGAHSRISACYAALLIFFAVFTVWLSILDRRFLLAGIAVPCFLASDLVLSAQYFVPGKKEDRALTILDHALYYAAQILVVCWLFTLTA